MRLLLMGASLMLAVLACGDQSEPAPVADEIAPDTTASEPVDVHTPVETEVAPEEPDTLVQAEVGAELKFTLEANPTTGYHWVLAGIDQDGDIVVQAGDPVYTQDANPRGMTGVGGTEEWVFSAVCPGEGLIRLDYMPPGTGREPGRTWSARVVVQ